MRIKLLTVIAVLAFVALFLSTTASALAVDYYVDTLGTNDGTHGTSPEASAWLTIQYAIDNVPNPTTATIVINIAAGTYILNNDDILIDRNFTNLTLKRAGAASTFIQPATTAGASTSKVIDIGGAETVTLRDLTIRNGRGQSEYNAGGIDPGKAITAFTIPGQVGSTTIDEGVHTVALTMPYGTVVTALVPTITHTGASISPASGVAHDFTTNPQIYTVTAAVASIQAYAIIDASTQAYAVTVTVAANPAKAITAFTIPGQAGSTTIDEGAHTVALTMPYGTDVTALVPTITHTGAAVSPASGAANDFTTPQTYTVTAADATTQAYIVTVNFAINTYTVTATAGVNGALDAATPSPVNVASGETTSFIFNADTGYHVASVSGCNGTTYTNTSNAVTSYTYTTGAITGACTVTATFAINQYQVEFLHNANGHLSGNLTQTIDHGQNCSPVTAIPNLGYRLQEWSGDYAGSDNPLTIRDVTTDITINAVFINDPPQVVIVSPLDGSQAYGMVSVKANVTDDTRIARVEFYVDGKLQERITTSQAESKQILPSSGKNGIKEVHPNSAVDIPECTLQNGIWQFDLKDAQAIFLNAKRKARKVDSNGRISTIIHPDVAIAHLQLLPQINSLAVAFSEPQALEDGKYYAIVLADFSKGALTGLEAAPALIAGNFQTSPAFQTDGLNNLYYLMYNANQTLVMRTWNITQQAITLFGSDRPILEWQVAQEGAIIVKSAPVAKGMSAIRIWHPRLGWIGENQSLLSLQTMRQWSRAAVSRGLVQSNHLETYFPQSAEIFHGRFDDIQAVSLLDNLILIAGSQADVARVELLDRDGNTSVIVPTGSLEVRKTSWLSRRQALLAGYDQASKKYVLAMLQWQPDEPPAIISFCEVTGMPLQIQGAEFMENAGMLSGESDPGTVEQKELKDAPLDLASQISRADISNESSQFTFNWDTMNFSVANHVLRVVAYDDANASGADEITVKVLQVKLDLLAERREAHAFSILRQYGQIRFLVEDFGIPVAQYRILRKKGAGNFELLKAITPAELQNNQFQMQDKYLEKGTAYTYRVEACNGFGQLLGISSEKTI